MGCFDVKADDMPSGTMRPVFTHSLCDPWALLLTTMCLYIPIYRMGIVIALIYRVIVVDKWKNAYDQ